MDFGSLTGVRGVLGFKLAVERGGGVDKNVITNGFLAGINTLQFIVDNEGTSPNPSGLRVELSGIARLDLRTSVALSGGIATITWVSQPGRTYRVQWKAQLTDPVWNDLLPEVVATSGISVKTQNVGAATGRVYRVLLLP